MRWLVVTLVLAGCGFKASGQPGGQDAPGGDAPRGDAMGTSDGPVGDASIDAPMLDAAENCQTSIAYTQIGGSRYIQLTITPTTWTAAETACEISGSHLIVFDDANEVTATDSFIIGSTWIGVSDRINEGTYRAVTAQSTFLSPGSSHQPDDCVRIDEATDTLDDRNCGELNPVVCECDGQAVVPANF